MPIVSAYIPSIFLLFFLIPSYASAQSWAFVTHAGGSGNDYGSRVATDAIGNSYITGEYQSQVKFDTITLQSHGVWNVFLAKYNTNGNVVWAKNIASTADQSSDVYTNAICVDKSGNVYLGGQFIVDITISDSAFIAAGASDMFLAKFTNTGALVWAKQAGGTGLGNFGQDAILGMALDLNSNLYLTGSYNIDAKFDTLSLSSRSTMELFIAKYDSAGKAQWAISPQGTGISEYGAAIAVDVSGNCYVTGPFFGRLTLGKDTADAIDPEQKIFIAKIDRSGKPIWLKKVGNGGYYGTSGDIKLDRDDNFYITGFFRANMAIGSENWSHNYGYDYTAFVAKYDSAGTVLWANKADGDVQNSAARCAAIDTQGNVFIVGRFTDSVSLGSTLLVDSGAQSIGFVAQMNPGGGFKWAKQLNCSGSLVPACMAALPSGDCIIVGTFDGTMSIGFPGIPSFGGSDIFLAKLLMFSSGVLPEHRPSQPFVLYPNPAKDVINLTGSMHEDIRIFSITGVEVLKTGYTDRLDISGLMPDTYFLKAGTSLYKFIKE